MSELIGLHKKYHNCLEDIYFTYGSWCNRDCTVMYVDSWNFGYVSKNVKYGEKIVKCLSSNRMLNIRSLEQIELLKAYSGIHIDWKEISYSEENLLLIQKKATDGIAVIHMDVFWCPWTNIYQKVHLDHYCIVTCVTDKHLVCLDPFYGNTLYVLSYSDFISGVRGLVSIDITIGYQKPEWISLVKLSVERAKNDFCCMDNFIQDILDYESLCDYIEKNRDLHSSILVFRLTQIGNGRTKYALLLNVVSNIVNDVKLELFSNEFLNVAKDWITVKNLVIKMYLSGCRKEDVIFIANKVKAITESELILYSKLVKHF